MRGDPAQQARGLRHRDHDQPGAPAGPASQRAGGRRAEPHSAADGEQDPEGAGARRPARLAARRQGRLRPGPAGGGDQRGRGDLRRSTARSRSPPASRTVRAAARSRRCARRAPTGSGSTTRSAPRWTTSAWRRWRRRSRRPSARRCSGCAAGRRKAARQRLSARPDGAATKTEDRPATAVGPASAPPPTAGWEKVIDGDSP